MSASGEAAPAPSAPGFDATAETEQAQATDVPVEVVELRTETSSTFATPQGQLRTEVSLLPVNFTDGAGNFQPVDDRLVPVEGGGWRVAAAGFAASLPASLGSGPVRIGEDDLWLELRLEGAASTPGEVEGNVVTYREVFPGVDVQFAATGSGLQKLITLSGPEVKAEYAFAVTTSADTKVQASKAGVTVRRPGSAGFVVPLPWAVDGGDDLEAAGGSPRVKLKASKTDAGYRLDLELDRKWLADPERVFPVVLDPSLYREESSMKDCFIYKPQVPDSTYCAFDRIDIGGNADITRRGLLQFDLTSIPGDSTVTDMILRGTTQAAAYPIAGEEQVAVHRMTSRWSPTSVAWGCRDQFETFDGCNPWPGGGEFDPAVLSQNGVPMTGGVTVQWHGLGPLAQDWVRNPAANLGLMLKVVNEPRQAVVKIASAEHATQRGAQAIIDWVPRTGEQGFETMYRDSLTDRSEVAVNVANGNLLLSAQDLSVAGTGLDFTVDRSYNSLSAFRGVQGPAEGNGALGAGWSTGTLSDTALYVSEISRVATFYGPDGRVVPFTLLPDGRWTAPPAQNATLLRTASNALRLTFHDSNTRFEFGRGTLNEYTLNRVVDRNGNTITTSYSSSPVTGAPSSLTDTQRRVYAVGYTTAGGQLRMSSVTDPSGRAQRYGYDTSGRLVSVQNGEPGVGPTLYAYSGSLLTTITDPAGRQTRMAYDSAGRVSSLIRVTNTSTGAGHVTRFAYPNATTSTVTDARGNRTTYTLDSQRRVSRAADANGNGRDRTYTANSTVADFTGAATGAVTYTYGANSGESLTGRKLKTGASDTVTYGNTADTAGRQFLPSASRSASQSSFAETKLSYDSAGNLAQSVTNNETGKTAMNTNGTVRSVTSPKNVATTSGRTACASSNTTVAGASTAADNCSTVGYTYLSAGTLSSRTSTPPVGAKWLRASTTNYDTLGRVVSVRDGRGVTTSYAYDGLDRPTRVSYSDGTPAVTTSYDGSGNTLSTADGSGTTTVGYDQLNRATRRAVPGRVALTYGYDQVGNLTSSVEGTATTSYVYGTTNTLTSLTEPDGAVTTFGYDRDDRRTSTTFPASTGVVQNVIYDAAGRVKRVTSRKGSSAPLVDLEYCYAIWSSGTCSTTASYDRDLVQWRQDNVTGVRTTYSYDASQRLTRAVEGGRTYGYGYDKNANRSSETVSGNLSESAAYSHDVADALCSRRAGVTTGATCADTASSTTTLFAHDASGNMTANGAVTATYNGANQTTRYGTPTFSYAGTGQGDRLSAGATSFTNGLLGTQQQTTNGAGTDYSSTPDGQLVSITTPNVGKHYYLQDNQGSIIGLINTSGARTATYTYDPYGAHPTATGTAAAANPFRYISGYLDTSTGLYKLGIRYYNPTLGRFTQTDPTGQDPHYTYARNNPCNLTDRSGAASLLDQLCSNGALKAFRAIFSVAPGGAGGAITSSAQFLSTLTSAQRLNFRTLAGAVGRYAAVQVARGAARASVVASAIATGGDVVCRINDITD